ncbi:MULTISPECIES: Na+/H+ antiporter subunit E [Dethiosulfovibrio]|uniref:Na+/H+ antiporter subunit E n=2 Tax=Dethiosulfovibrio TaxID=47054 RepID=A0ABS9EPD4_9BACT|nr:MULTISPECIES: Na+/H+ antiporter subunit E [Dethiosulfovibrio]MCF4114751.1 Na+/H+ antiporter subunit E [Dethiosulfovibrio russensis]MCF4143044.1 Na+/H+ antiporter subunit E [Dethiosulfovibrio marinus]MCF4145256.1 Na+/H+ antiporter subunit E [Dethiosulfovibrio acidaminovorans]
MSYFKAGALWCSLMVLWISLTGRLDFGFMAVGVAVSTAVFRLVWRTFSPHHEGGRLGSPRIGFARLMAFLCFVPCFLWDLLKATWEVSLLALAPKVDLHSGIIKVNSDVPDKSSLVFLANLITLTPGTLTLDADMSKHDLFVHVLDLRGLGTEAVRSDISDLEARIGRLFS